MIWSDRDQELHDEAYDRNAIEALDEKISELEEDKQALTEEYVKAMIELQTKPDDIPLVRKGPGIGYYQDVLAKDVEKKWVGFEPLVVTTVISCSVVSFLWGLLF